MKQQWTNYLLIAVFGWYWTTCPSCPAAAQSVPDVAASVGDQRVTVQEVQWLLERKLGDRLLGDEVKLRLEAEVLEQLVKQLIVLDFLDSTDHIATDDEIRLASERIAEEAKRIDKTLEQVLAEQDLTLQHFSQNLKWQISWKRYTDRLLTDENLEKFFVQNRRRYDGTEIRVAHLLLKLDAGSNTEKTIQRAEEIRQRLLSGEVSWRDAVKHHSQAPTADRAGDLGWIKISGPMPVKFTEAAFELEFDDVSEAVVTQFGVHLIRCLEVRPGGINWYDADPSLRKDAVKFLFDKIVEDQRPRVSVRYTGRTSYIDPETGELSGSRPESDRN